MENNTRYFEIINILHTGNRGPAGIPKEGPKYDRRRHRICTIDVDNLVVGESVALPPVIVWTTPFEKFYFKDGLYHLVTINSEYLLKEINF